MQQAVTAKRVLATIDVVILVLVGMKQATVDVALQYLYTVHDALLHVCYILYVIYFCWAMSQHLTYLCIETRGHPRGCPAKV